MELRVGGTGAGLFVGCGAGVGLVTPMSLYGVPVVGQVVSSLAQSLGSFDAALGGVGRDATSRVRALSSGRLNAGFGCGVVQGYGYGAGFMLRPDAAQFLTEALQRLRADAARRLNLPQLVAGGTPERALQLEAAALQPGTPGECGARTAPHSTPVSQCSAGLKLAACLTCPPAGPLQGTHEVVGAAVPVAAEQPAAAKRAQRSRLEEQVAELARLAVRQQNTLDVLSSDIASLRATVCRLDPGAPPCEP